MENGQGYELELKSHIERERAAVKLQSKVGELLYEKGIELVLFRNHLTDVTISEILNLHEYAKKVVNKPIDVFTTSELAAEISTMDIVPSKLASLKSLNNLKYLFATTTHPKFPTIKSKRVAYVHEFAKS